MLPGASLPTGGQKTGRLLTELLLASLVSYRPLVDFPRGLKPLIDHGGAKPARPGGPLLQTGSTNCVIRPPTNPRDRAGRPSRRPVQVIAAGARAVVGVRAADLPVHPWEQPEPRRVLVNGALPLRRSGHLIHVVQTAVRASLHGPPCRSSCRGRRRTSSWRRRRSSSRRRVLALRIF